MRFYSQYRGSLDALYIGLRNDQVPVEFQRRYAMKTARSLRYFIPFLSLSACLLCPLLVMPQQSNRSQTEKPGKPLGPETDAYFDEVVKRKQQLPPGPPSREDPHSPADLNRDGKCNRTDLNLFRRVMGRCARSGGSALVTFADFDGDNCVTRRDTRSFQQLWRACRARKTR